MNNSFKERSPAEESRQGPCQRRMRAKVRIWQTDYEITHPKGAQAVLDRIEIVSEGGLSVPVVIAITGVYSN